MGGNINIGKKIKLKEESEIFNSMGKLEISFSE